MRRTDGDGVHVDVTIAGDESAATPATVAPSYGAG